METVWKMTRPTDENLGVEPKNLRTKPEVQRLVKGRRVNYWAHFRSAAALAEFRETYRIPDDVTRQLVPLGVEAKPVLQGSWSP